MKKKIDRIKKSVNTIIFCYVDLETIFKNKNLCIVRLTSINLQKKILKNPVFKSTIFFLYVN